MTQDLIVEYDVPPVSDVSQIHDAVLQRRLRGPGHSPIHVTVTFPLDVFHFRRKV